MILHGWGRYPTVDGKVYHPASPEEVRHLLHSQSDGVTPRGLGRSYGDSSLGGHMLDCRRLDHLLAFDARKGLLYCEAGVSLNDILEVFVPKGWFLPVTPGTRFVTVGGAIASDVHGKNHHVNGCFSEHIEFIELCLDEERILRCSRDEHPDLFRATCGGMGLSGMILSAAIQLKQIKSSFIDQTTFKANNLDESLELFEIHEDKPYSVAWIDCIAQGRSLGRSLLMTGDHAENGGLVPGKGERFTLPVNMPSMLLNKHSIKLFNTLYYHRVSGTSVSHRVHYEPFFYPLDSISDWNRMYGKNGFTQYQFVIPKAAGKKALSDILKTIAASGKGSFLAVLKAFGKRNENLLSFPMEGYTLALDFKIEKNLFPLLDSLDAMVLDHGGRLYLTKDARMCQETFRLGYSEWTKFQNVRERYGVRRGFQSLQSKRLGLD